MASENFVCKMSPKFLRDFLCAISLVGFTPDFLEVFDAIRLESYISLARFGIFDSVGDWIALSGGEGT